MNQCIRKYNKYDSPSSEMRMNYKYLKMILIVNKKVMKSDFPDDIKRMAKSLYDRTTRYCKSNYLKAFDEQRELEEYSQRRITLE